MGGQVHLRHRPRRISPSDQYTTPCSIHGKKGVAKSGATYIKDSDIIDGTEFGFLNTD
jgi:hypothetical protein